MSEPFDPTCLIHGKKYSEHTCLYCCLCFKSLEESECAFKPNGKREDVCVECAENEQESLVHELKKLRDRVHELEAFLRHPQMSTWHYIENGGMYDDIAKLMKTTDG